MDSGHVSGTYLITCNDMLTWGNINMALADQIIARNQWVVPPGPPTIPPEWVVLEGGHVSGTYLIKCNDMLTWWRIDMGSADTIRLGIWVL